eukprot:Colp12_sorted_trinity150504_noHs@19507
MMADSAVAPEIVEPSRGTAERYDKIKKLGEGQFAVVHLGLDKVTNKKVAIKKIKVGQGTAAHDGLNVTALREIKMLRELHHSNVISLLDVFSHKQNVSLVFEFCETDLEVIIKDKSIIFETSDIKSYMLMMLRGIEYLHQNWILHRDMKPNNLLIDHKGVLKITDFGLARYHGSPQAKYTNTVVTIFYRAPELLYGADLYGWGVDLWAVGCIFAELMLRTPFFPGNNELDQLQLICRALGTPTEKDWPGLGELKLSQMLQVQQWPATPWENMFPAASPDTISLLAALLKYDPQRRITATEALKHVYFFNEPAPTKSDHLPKLGKTEEKTSKRPLSPADSSQPHKRRLQF